MCGIAGIVNLDGAGVDSTLLARMNEAIRHRGPDEEGSYLHANVGLAMRRLAIIDLAGGQQPITNEDRTCWIVFNGEIYNYRELKARTAPVTCAACSPSRSGTRANESSSSRATASAKSLCSTRRRAARFCSARSSRRSSCTLRSDAKSTARPYTTTSPSCACPRRRRPTETYASWSPATRSP